MDKILLNILVKVLPLLMSQLTPFIKNELVDFILMLEKKANETPNDVDNILVDFLKVLFNIPGGVK